MIGNCKSCGSTHDLVRHHVSYRPETIQILCRACHGKTMNRHSNSNPHKDWNVPVPWGLDDKVNEFIKKNPHISKAELIRDAVRRLLEEGRKK